MTSLFYPKKSFWFWSVIHLILLSCLVFIFNSFDNTKSLVINPTFINVYQTPNMNSQINSQVISGERVLIDEESDNWLHIKTRNNKQGWLNKQELQQTKIKTPYHVQVTTNQNTNLYSLASNTSKQIATIKANSKIFILNKQGNFLFTKTTQGFYGWININNIKASDKSQLNLVDKTIKNLPKTLYAKNNQVILYAKRDKNSTKIYHFKAGEKMTRIAIDENWYQVKTTDGKTGWLPTWNTTSATMKKAQKVKNQSLKGKTIIIDPGHGGSDPGSLTSDNRHEADATLATSKTVEKLLKEHGANVIMTRTKDTDVSLAKRAQISNDKKADAFICIHYDSTEKHNIASGTTTYYYHDNSIELANDINNQLAANLPLKNKGVQFGDHQVTRDNNQPAVLLELGYLSNDNDANLAFSQDYQDLVANSILTGLETFFNTKTN